MEAELKEKIAKLENEFNWEKEIAMNFPELKTLAYLSGEGKHVSIKLRNQKLSDIRGLIKNIIQTYPATETSQEIKANVVRTHFSGYRLQWCNGVRDSYARIMYKSNDIDVWIELPIEFYSDDVKGCKHRKVYDSEYHYFTGMGRNKIEDIRLYRHYLDMFENIDWYGGNTTTYISDVTDWENYEYVIFNGHVKEFQEQHDTVLENLSKNN